MLTHTYQLVILGRDGMYTYGETADSPALARLVPGYMHRRPGDRLGIQRTTRDGSTWIDSAGHTHLRALDSVIVEAETTPGEWTIGA